MDFQKNERYPYHVIRQGLTTQKTYGYDSIIIITYYRQTKGSHCSACFHLKRWDQKGWSKPGVIVQVMWVDACQDIGEF